MARRVKDEKPLVPDETCPYIDMAQEMILGMVETKDEEWRSTQSNLAVALLEYIRESNARLRRSSKYWYNKNRG